MKGLACGDQRGVESHNVRIGVSMIYQDCKTRLPTGRDSG